MMLLQNCDTQYCKARVVCTYSDDIGKELQMPTERAVQELRKRLKYLLRKGHKNGEHNARRR